MADNGRGQLLKHKSNGVYTPTTQPLVSMDSCFYFSFRQFNETNMFVDTVL